MPWKKERSGVANTLARSGALRQQHGFVGGTILLKAFAFFISDASSIV
jgi:hypothetical protein